MDSLDAYASCLNDAREYIEADRPFHAMMQLKGAWGLLRPIHDYNQQTRIAFEEITMVYNSLSMEWLRRDTKYFSLNVLDSLIDDVEDWKDCRRAA